VLGVNTTVRMGKIVPQKWKRYLIKEDDFKIAYVTLPQGSKFKFPDLFSQEKFNQELESMQKQQKEVTAHESKYKRQDPMRKGLPGWFSI